MSRNLQKSREKVVGLGRFELPTHGLGNRFQRGQLRRVSELQFI